MTDREIYGALWEQLRQGKSAVLVSSARQRALYSLSGSAKEVTLELLGTTFGDAVLPPLETKTRSALLSQARAPQLVVQFQLAPGDTDTYVAIVYSPPARLIVCGGGHISQPLVKMAALLDFVVTVIDDRPFFANAARFPEAAEVICGPFDQALASLILTRQTYAVVVTRGHRHDAMCVRQLILANIAYLGMIGSRRRVREMREVFLAEGFANERVAALYAPIGLEINAETPAEIAVSILAEITSLKNRPSRSIAPWAGGCAADLAVVQAVTKEDQATPLAVATIVSTWGSAPRKAGAQMLIYPDGRTVGTIGGGCVEADVRRKALTVIADGCPEWYAIDMTGPVMEDEGLACGGKMLVLIERV
ncbi:MAG: XdhC family protein [Firmicutes bacterium]|nr:XdhC family protein [Dethiobacter sp.]MBS3889689.1 XdhC family protein [Bacillota bacterium]MBS4053674.1 XdhC family protein [Thermaerobacter sp.]